MKRRKFIKNIAGVGVASIVLPPLQASATVQNLTPISGYKIVPKGLVRGDTIAITGPAGAINDDYYVKRITDRLDELGFKYVLGETLNQKFGYLAGTDELRAKEFMQYVNDDSIKAILTMRGGWGCARILDLLDYKSIAAKPKIIMGFSDITSLVNAVYVKTGLVTFHGPCGYSTWTDFTTNYVTMAAAIGSPFTMKNPSDYLKDLKTLSPGKGQGELVGGNLTVMQALIGTDYEPNWENKILFLEETSEEPYRIDRMLWQMKQAGIFDKINGLVFGSFNKCEPEEPEKSFTLLEILEQHFSTQKFPVYMGATFGHMSPKFTLPIGVRAEIDADKFTIRTLEKSVLA